VNTNCASDSPTKIYVLEPNRMLRESFVRLLRKRTDLTVVGDRPDGPEALEQLTMLACDVLLVSSLETLRAIGQGIKASEVLGKTKVLMFGMDEDAETFLQAVRLGACGYLLKEASSTEIIAAVQGVAQGEAVCAPKLCKWLFEYVSKGAPHRSGEVEQRGGPATALSCRQRQLMALVARGMTNKEIASSLRLSEFTVRNRIRRIMAHLQADSRHAAVDAIRLSGLFLSAEENHG
jgi:two-component system nitrate/nitrite response regulator NarL